MIAKNYKNDRQEINKKIYFFPLPYILYMGSNAMNVKLE